MKKYFNLLLLFVFIQTFHFAFSQNKAPGILWQQTIGGSNADVLTSMAIGPDKSIVLCGYSNSKVSGNKSDASFGGYDYWVVKLDATGSILWNKTFGGNKDDFASAIISTSDGGYLLGGSSISDKSGTKSNKSYGFSYDYWVLKLDANGNQIWDKTLGGFYNDRLTSLAELPNAGGYVIGGYSYSQDNGSKTITNLGAESNADYWVMVLNNNGKERMQNLFGGGSHEILTCVAPVGIAGANSYYAAGWSYSTKRPGYKSEKVFGNNDYYIVRYNTVTKKTEYQGDFGGKLSDYLTCMQSLPDNSLIMGGYSNSYKSNTKKTNFFGVTDFWLLKLLPNGKKQWDKTIAGSGGGDYLMSVQQTKDKGFILGGYSNSNTGVNKTENSRGGYDYWIVKTDSLGKVQWDKTIGGNADDKITAVYEVDSNRYVVAGTSASAKSGDKNMGVIGSKGTDFWVMTIGAETSSVISSGYSQSKLEIVPNPVKDILTIRYNAAVNDKVGFVIYAADGKAVLQSTLTAPSQDGIRTFNVANLPGGSYFAVMYVGNNKITKTFIKQ
jgi:hypothetical protein